MHFEKKFEHEKEILVSIIVLNYNAGELLLNCIDSIKKSTYTNLEILVVDNISSDNSQKKCKEKFPDIELIQNDKTIWEKEPIEKLAKQGELAAYKHTKFWHPLDTLRDKNYLEELWTSGNADWKVW